MSDLISRQDAIMHFVKVSKNYECGMFDLAEVTHELWEIVSAQPSVEERPKSKWWFSEGEWQCMNCGSELELEDITPFCPCCGADMRGDDK